ncbi:MAG: hypothetical protein C4329_12975 [Chitinophagaceae bacterium]
MKTLLVATDFSAAADNALHYAARLASRINASLKLLHVYTVPVSMNDMPVLMVSAENLKHNADNGLSRLKEELQKNYGAINVETDSRLGDLRSELEDVCKSNPPLAIIIGAHGVTGFERLVFGSNATAIIRHSKVPVIAVPANYNGSDTKKIVMAFDLQNNHSLPIDDIKQWVGLLNAELHILHITSNSSGEKDERKDLLTRFGDLSVVYEEQYSHDLQKGIEAHIKKIGADMLLIVPHQHNLMERIFFRQHTEDIVYNASVPVLSICC